MKRKKFTIRTMKIFLFLLFIEFCLSFVSLIILDQSSSVDWPLYILDLVGKIIMLLLLSFIIQELWPFKKMPLDEDNAFLFLVFGLIIGAMSFSFLVSSYQLIVAELAGKELFFIIQAILTQNTFELIVLFECIVAIGSYVHFKIVRRKKKHSY